MNETDCPWDDYGERVIWVPLGPWTKECALNKCFILMATRVPTLLHPFWCIVEGDRVNRREFIAAQLIQEDFAGIGGTLRPVLVASGNPEETVDRWIREQEAEVREMKVKIYIKVNNIRPLHPSRYALT